MSTRIEAGIRVQSKSYVQSLVALRAADRLSRKLYIGEWVEEAAVPVTIAFAEAAGAPRLPLFFSGRFRYG
jgi:hypothetical protein